MSDKSQVKMVYVGHTCGSTTVITTDINTPDTKVVLPSVCPGDCRKHDATWLVLGTFSGKD